MRYIFSKATFVILFFYSGFSFAGINPSIELEKWEASAKYVNFHEHRISYHDFNKSSKEVILMIHGFPTSSFDWHELKGFLGSNYRLLSIDMLGFGFSDKPRHHEYSIDEQVDLHLALLKKLDVNNVHIIAHDYGSLVAEEMLARLNAGDSEIPKIQSLVILNGPVLPAQVKLTFFQKVFKNILTGPMGGIASQFSTRFVFEKGFTTVFGENTKPSKQELKDVWITIKQKKGQKIFHKLVHFYNESIERGDRWVNAVKETKVPMLSINGSSDPAVGEDVADYKPLVPNSKTVTLENIGHYPQLEDSESVAKVYMDFITSLQRDHSVLGLQ